MQLAGSNELLEHVQNKGLCIGCGGCVELCPYFRNHGGKTAMLFPCTLEEGRCFAHCPKVEVDLETLSSRHWGEPYAGAPLGKYEQVLAARAGQALETGNYQGGGVVSALITYALKQGIIEGAVLTDREGFMPVPRLVEDWREVASFSSSKFTAAPTLGVLNRAVREGKKNLGVVGTPCQMTSIAQMKVNPLNRENFEDPVALTIGLFCNWALDPKPFAEFLAGRVESGRVKGMDIPPPPAEKYVVTTENGIIEIPLEEIRPFIPTACLTCPDMTSEWADVSAGMFEGRPGWNTLLVRTEKGRRLVEDAVRDGFLETEAMPDDNFNHLSTAAGNKKRRAVESIREMGLLNVNGDGGCAALRIPEDALESIIG